MICTIYCFMLIDSNLKVFHSPFFCIFIPTNVWVSALCATLHSSFHLKLIFSCFTAPRGEDVIIFPQRDGINIYFKVNNKCATKASLTLTWAARENEGVFSKFFASAWGRLAVTAGGRLHSAACGIGTEEVKLPTGSAAAAFVSVFPPHVPVFSLSLWLKVHPPLPSNLTFIVLRGFSPTLSLSSHLPSINSVETKNTSNLCFLLSAHFVFPRGFRVRSCLQWVPHQGSPRLPLSYPSLSSSS